MSKQLKIVLIVMFVCTMFLGIGYAGITDISLEIDGDASLPRQRGIYISNITLDSTTHTSTSSQVINTYYQTMMNTRVVLGEESDSQVTYEVTIYNGTNTKRAFDGVVFDPSFYSNNEIQYVLSNLAIGDEIAPKTSKTFQITFNYADTTHTNNILDSVLNFDFIETEASENFTIDGSCVFHGQNQDVTGVCVEPDEHVDYINKNFSLFSAENIHRDFIMELHIGEVDDSRFRQGKVDTIISDLNEDGSQWPGLVFRIEDRKWYFQAGYGSGRFKKSFERDSFSVFRIIRDDDKIYYQLDDTDPVLAADMSNFTAYFTTPLTLGVALYPNGTVREERYFIGEITYLRFAFEEQDVNVYAPIDRAIEEFLDTTLTTVYSNEGPVTFDGTADTGMHTNVSLFDSTNYSKDFVATIEIDSFNAGSQIQDQATIFNAKDETGNGYPGVCVRKKSNGNQIVITLKDGEGLDLTATIPGTTKRINIIKKGMDIYYQYDLGQITLLGSMANFDPAKCFATEATFGSNINEFGEFDRVIQGTLSNMTIKMGP